MTSFTTIPVYRIQVGEKISTQKDAILGDSYEPATPCPVNLDPLQRRTIETLIKMLRENRLSYAEDFITLGANLYSVLFYDKDGKLNEIGEELIRVINLASTVNDAVSDTGTKLLRIELEFKKEQQELGGWPWEYLYCPQIYGEGPGEYYLAQVATIVLTRYLALGSGWQVRSLQIDKTPIKILLVVSSPEENPGGETLDPVAYVGIQEMLQELEKHTDANEQQLFNVTPLIDANNTESVAQPSMQRDGFTNFIEMAVKLQPHVIHFIGHGRFERGVGQIAFAQPDRTALWVSATDLAAALMTINSLRMVFLHACESGLSGRPSSYQAVSGVAHQLAQNNIPAVVAMHYRVRNKTVSKFAGAFYRALAEYLPVEVAMQKGREALRQEMAIDNTQLGAFGLPVLYLRGKGGFLSPAVRSVKTAVPTPDISPGKDGRKTSSPDGASQVPYTPGNAPGAAAFETACPWCQQIMIATANFCKNCGGALRCADCGMEVVRGGGYCGNCGAKLRQPK